MYNKQKLLETKRSLSTIESRLCKETSSQKLSDVSSALDLDLLYNRCQEIEILKAKILGEIEKIANDFGDYVLELVECQLNEQ